MYKKKYDEDGTPVIDREETPVSEGQESVQQEETNTRDGKNSRSRHSVNKPYLPVVVMIVTAVVAVILVTILCALNIQGQKQIKAVSAEYKSLQSQMSEIRKENEQLKAEYDKLKKSDDQLKKDYETLKKAKAERKDNDSDSARLYGKTVYLTFDDGPSPVTPEILETLRKYNVKATFFVINGKYNDYITDIAKEGHTVALHTYSHDYEKIYASTDAFIKDLKQIDDLVFEKTGKRATITRFPGGGSNTMSANYCKGIMTELTKKIPEMGYHYFDWNADSGDAGGYNVAASKLIANVKRDLSYSGYDRYIVLMHDAATKSTTADALPEIIEWILAEGGTIAPLDDTVPEVHHAVNN